MKLRIPNKDLNSQFVRSLIPLDATCLDPVNVIYFLPKNYSYINECPSYLNGMGHIQSRASTTNSNV